MNRFMARLNISKWSIARFGILMVLFIPSCLMPEFRSDANTNAQTIGVLLHDQRAYQGYTLFAPLNSTTTYLIDMEGNFIHTWPSDFTPGNAVYLLEDGSLLRTASLGQNGNRTFTAGGSGGRVQRISWEGDVLWDFEYSSDQYLLHHDIELLPNGNVLMIAWEYKSAQEAIAMGRSPNLLNDGELWPDHVIEVDPASDEIVWTWRVWDHLIQDVDPTKANYGVIADHPELINLNYVGGRAVADWNHINSIDYNEALDQILLSVHNFNEIWVIDHSTTTEEAASHRGGSSGKGGDLLYRWGNPQAYGMGTDGDRQLFLQHDAQWIEEGLPGEGNILIFNNGDQRRRRYSSVDEIVSPVNSDGNYALSNGVYGPTTPIWTYVAETPTEFYAQNISGAQRLPNGNTLICDGPHGTFFEVTMEGEMVWMYVNPVVRNRVLSQGQTIPQTPQGSQNSVFRAIRYAPDYPGLEKLFGSS